MEKSYICLSVMMLVILILVFIAVAALQTKIALYAIILFSLLALLFYIRDKAEKTEVVAMWFTLIMFIITAALIFKVGGF